MSFRAFSASGFVVSHAEKSVFEQKKQWPARDDEGHHHAVALFEFRHRAAGLDDDAHRLVAEDVAVFHAGLVAVEEMQVRAADRRGGNLDDGVRGFLNHGIGNCIDADVDICRARRVLS